MKAIYPNTPLTENTLTEFQGQAEKMGQPLNELISLVMGHACEKFYSKNKRGRGYMFRKQCIGTSDKVEIGERNIGNKGRTGIWNLWPGH